jgi:hypothetical protein
LVGLAELGFGEGDDFPGGAGRQRAKRGLLAQGAVGCGDGLGAAVGVAGGPGQDVGDVLGGVVVGEDRLLKVAGGAVGGQQAGGGGDGVGGVHDVAAVTVGRPGGGQELHRAEGSGAGWAVVGAVAAFDGADAGQDAPRDAVLRASFLVVGEVGGGNGGSGAAGGRLGGAGGGLLCGDTRDRADDHGGEQDRKRGDGGDGDRGGAAVRGRFRYQPGLF